MKKTCPSCFILGMALAISAASCGVMAKKTTLNILIWDAYNGLDKPVWVAFEKKHPDIKLKFITATWDKMDDKFIAMRAANMPVDVFFNYAVYGWASYANNGLFEDLGPFIKRDSKTFPKDLMPIALDCLKYDGKSVGILQNAMGASGVWYNMRLVQEAGLPTPTNDWKDMSWTWDKFVEYAKKMTKKDSNGKFTQMGVDFWTSDNIIQFCWSFGGDWFPKSAYSLGYADKTTLNSPQNIKAFQAIRDLKVRQLCSPSSETKGYAGEGWLSLYKSKLGMFIDPIQTAAIPPKNVKAQSKIAFAPMPVVPEVGRVDGFAWLEGMAMCKGTKNAQAAWTFMKWMMTDSAFNGNTRFPGNGVRKSSWSETLKAAEEVFDIDQSRQVILGSLDYIRSFPRCTIMGAKQVFDSVTARVIPSLGKMDAPDISQQLVIAQKEADSIMARMFIRAKRKK